MAVYVFSTPSTFLCCLIPSHRCSSLQTSNGLCQRHCSSQHWMLPLLNSSVLFQAEIEDRPPSRREEASSPSLLRGQDAALLQKIKALIINAALGWGRQGAVWFVLQRYYYEARKHLLWNDASKSSGQHHVAILQRMSGSPDTQRTFWWW